MVNYHNITMAILTFMTAVCYQHCQGYSFGFYFLCYDFECMFVLFIMFCAFISVYS